MFLKFSSPMILLITAVVLVLAQANPFAICESGNAAPHNLGKWSIKSIGKLCSATRAHNLISAATIYLHNSISFSKNKFD